ncbi:MAG: AMP-binding protein, partial [Gemmatimonadetes bacterium]|nr:AMP-binding protein [Gemmatimonadota bacterium]
MIRQYFRGRCLLVTGGTGFVGQALIAKILSGLGDEVERIYALIRPRRRADGQVIEPAQRLEELFETSLFEALRSDPERWQRLRDKVVPIAIDERQADLGMNPTERARIISEVDTIFNSAATVVFDEPLSVSLQANIDGPMALLELAHESGRPVNFVHVSTAYVNGQRHGVIADEELPLDRDMRQVIEGLPPAYDPVADVADCRAVCERTRDASRSAEQTRRFKREILAQHKSLSRKLTKSRLDRLTEERRQRWVDRRLVDEGMSRARAHGWNDVYTYTKAVGEQMLTLHRRDLPLVIVRPSIIESSLLDPEPGWITGLKVMDPLLAAYGRGMVPDFPARQDITLDLIPVDKVVNTTLAAASTATPDHVQVYHIATGDENPVRVSEVFEYVRAHFLAAPMLDRDGKAPKLPVWRYPSLRTFRLIFHLAYMWPIQVREWLGEKLPFYKMSSRQRRFLGTAKVRLQRVLYYTDIYHPYTNLDCCFKTTATRTLFEALPLDEQQDFSLDVRGIDWSHYIAQVHIPGVRRHVLREEAEAILPESPDELGAGEERLQAESQIETLADLLRWSCERHADRVALQMHRQGRLVQQTYAQLATEVERRAAGWQQAGLVAHDRVLLQGANGLEWVQSYFAASISGLAVVPVDPQTPQDEIQRLVDYVDARALIAVPSVLSGLNPEQSLVRIDLDSGQVELAPAHEPAIEFDEPVL